MSTIGTRTSSEMRGLEEGLNSERNTTYDTSDRNTPEEVNETKPRSRFLRFRKPTSKIYEEKTKLNEDTDEQRNQERAVSSASESRQKQSSSTEVFTDVFENIQMQLEIIGGVREKPWPMSRKLHILRNAKNYVEQHSGDLNRLQHLKESRIRLFRQVKRQFKNFIVFFIPWEKRIKNIQGHFGAGIGSFFLFLRSLVWINFILLTFITIFVIAPQLMSPSTAFSIPESEKHTAERLTSVLDAKGYLQYSFLFYGYYGNENIQVGVVEYPLPLAYFVVFLGIYLFSIITVLRAITHEQGMMASSGQNDQYTFGWRVFSAWDFLITERETADNKLASLTTAIKEQILEEVEKGKTTNKNSLIALRVLANVLVLGVLSASAYLIYLVVKRSDERLKEGRPPTVLEQYEISLAITGMNAVCPVFFKLIALMEQYHPRVALYWELTRIMFMYLGNMYVLVISLLNKINKSKTSPVEAAVSVGTNTTVIPVAMVTSNTTTGSLCWETTVGQELFKLTIIDLVALVFSVLTGDLIVSLTVRFLNCFQGRLMDLEKLLGYPEFKLAENVLQLINSQGLIWMGLIFSPGLIMLNILKLVIIMYLRSWAVMVTNVPPKRIFKASHQFYLFLLLVMLFLCMLAVGYAAVEIEPSKWCGPFRGKRNMYTVLTESIDNGPTLLNTVFDYLSGPSVVIPVFILMSIAIYYYRSRTNYLHSSNRELMLQLQYERTEDRKKIFRRASERHPITTNEDNNLSHPRGQTHRSQGRSRTHRLLNERTIDAIDNEPPGERKVNNEPLGKRRVDNEPRGERRIHNDPPWDRRIHNDSPGERMIHKESPRERTTSSPSLTQLTGGDSKKTGARQAQREDLVPLVTYNGVVEDTHAANVRAHREVKVIVHRSSSSCSSTISSVRSVEQRTPTSRAKQVLSRDHFQWNRESTNPDQSPSSLTAERSRYGEESIQLQVIGIAKDGTHSESSQGTIREGGSLAAMFDS